MGEIKVEHVLGFLVGAFLVHHMIGKCRIVEGSLLSPGYNNCAQQNRRVAMKGDSDTKDCSDYTDENECNGAYQEGSVIFMGAKNSLCTWDGDNCTTSDSYCSVWNKEER